jgi:transposase InsO family protein
MIKVQFGASMKTLMSDFGGEYKSREFDAFLKENGIQTQNSVPHMHQQNGRAEHFNRTLMDKAQALRLDACFLSPGGNLWLTLQHIFTTELQFNALSGVHLMNWFTIKFQALGTYMFLGVEPMFTYRLKPERISSPLEESS